MSVQVPTTELTYREALRHALAEEMRRDPRVVLLGEDVGEAGGVFKVTDGLYAEFGPQRVIDTPIAENGFVGAAFGMALTGLRPVVEIMFADFLGVAMDPIVNSMAKHLYMSGGQAPSPVVVRTAGGGGIRFGAQHSQTGESWLRVFPGLKIVAASSPKEAYLLLKAAIRDDNPVLFIEHKFMYGMKGPVPLGQEPEPLGRAAVVRPGRDVTIVATLLMVDRALKAAQILAQQDGIEAEVIDLRLLRPLDVETVVASVTKTGRLLTVEEQPVLGGWGGDVVAFAVAHAFRQLKAAPQRLGLPDAPLPFSPPLEDAAMPSPERIVETVRRMWRES